ncbi:mortality factor 4-like protein 2 [Macrotis lagotis]|uniref:mortality factor 4-like protein 2 n=1 Tax=Macrotis lagotis TaxID=92651 RepID=UPI003D685434
MPSTSRGDNNTSGGGPSTSKAGPSTSRASPSTSESVPSTSRAGPSTSRAEGSTSEAVSSTSEDYEWVPENRVLRYSRAQLKKDNDFTIFKLTRNAWEPALRQGYHQFSIKDDRKSDPSDSEEGTSTATHPSFRIRDEKGHTQRSKAWRGRRGTGVHKQEAPVQFEMHIRLPDCLMSLLVQDWEMVCLGKNLCNLPAKVSVEAILDEYAIDLTSCGTTDENYEVSALVTILKEYFNVILSTQLLYDFERAQHAELVNSYPSSQLSQIYGGIYLLRLLKQLGPMFNNSTLDESCLIVLMTHTQDLLDYLAFSPTLLFIDDRDYEPASDKYLKVAT